MVGPIYQRQRSREEADADDGDIDIGAGPKSADNRYQGGLRARQDENGDGQVRCHRLLDSAAHAEREGLEGGERSDRDDSALPAQSEHLSALFKISTGFEIWQASRQD